MEYSKENLETVIVYELLKKIEELKDEEYVRLFSLEICKKYNLTSKDRLNLFGSYFIEKINKLIKNKNCFESEIPETYIK